RIRRMLYGGGDVELGGGRGRDGTDQHHPGAPYESPEIGPPEGFPHPDVAWQIARVVRHVDRPAELVGGGGEELREERHPAKARGVPLRRRKREREQRPDREHREDRDHQVSETALRRVDLVVAERREGRRTEREEHDGRGGGGGDRAVQLVQRLRGQHLI